MLHKEDKKKVEQIQMIALDQLVPADHLLRKIDRYVDFDFIYDLVEDLYCPDNGRPSIDPVVLIKLVFLQHLYGIRSMRQTIKEVEVNLAYRWFLGLDFYDKIPHFTTFGQNYRRRFQDTDLFESIFTNILQQAMDQGFVDTRLQFVDATHVKAHANRHKNKKAVVKKHVRSYQQQLEKEIADDRNAHGKDDLKPPKNPPTDTTTITQSTTDPESGLFHKGEHKEVFAYTIQTACDAHGWILACQSFPGNRHDSSTFFDFLPKLQTLKPEKLVMDAGYKTPAIAKTLLEKDILPVFPYTRPKHKPALDVPYYKRDFVYDAYYDCYLCPEETILPYSTTTREGYREYKSNPKICKNCPTLHRCTASKNHQKTVTRHLWQDALDVAEDYRYTTQGKAEYKQRKETIERQFGSAKEYHGLRYTNQRGRKKMDLKAVLTFACMNMKKLALMMDRKERDGGGDGPSFADLWKKYIKKRQTPSFVRSLSAV